MFSHTSAPLTAGVVLVVGTCVIAIASSEFRTAGLIAMIGGAITCVVGLVGALYAATRPATRTATTSAVASPHGRPFAAGADSASVMTAHPYVARRRSLLPTR